MDLIDTIKSKVKYSEYYPQYIQNFDPSKKAHLCPFHEDTNPSFTVEFEKGLWHCFACGAKGDFIKFYQKVNGLTIGDAIQKLCKEYGITIPEKKVLDKEEILVDLPHHRLMTSQDLIDKLYEGRGITPETLKRFKIGFNGRRYTIPIYDIVGDLVNVRLYAPGVKGQKFLNTVEGGVSYGAARLFPSENLNQDGVIICEGEMDCILLNQLGYHAITNTAGADTWKASWNKLFADKIVYIVYDNDNPGIIGSNKVAKNLAEYAREVYVVRLPVDNEGEDVTDYFLHYSKTTGDFDKLLAKAEKYEVNEVDTSYKDMVSEVSLAQANNAAFDGCKVSFLCKISGKDLTPYIVPKKMQITCSMQAGRVCQVCPVARNAGNFILEFREDDTDILKMISIGDNELRGVIKDKAEIPKRCRYAVLEKLESYNIEELRAIPETEYAEEDLTYISSQIFHNFKDGNTLETNRTFKLTGRTTPNPKNQHATVLSYEAISAQDTIDSFRLSESNKEDFKLFQPKEKSVDSIREKFLEICEDIEHVTRIIERRDLILAILLAYCSPLQFYFQGMLQRGWIDCLILGDTGSGKTETAKGILNHLKAGEMTTGEGSSYAGLVGGLTKVNERWSLEWGLIPLNNRKIVIIDEASGLTVDDFAKMSSMRSSGLAEVRKIQSGKTSAKTRLVWISNPRESRTLSSYDHGIRAVSELIGKPEDIRRLDYVLAVASGEVDIDKVNLQDYFNSEKEIAFTSEIFHDFILWIWKLKPDSITFTKEAETKILEYANLQGKKYSATIPLVESADQRIKVARISAALACMFAQTEDFENVVVDAHIVEFAYRILEKWYSKKSLAYGEYSRVEMSRRELKYESDLKKLIDSEDLKAELLDAQKMSVSELSHIFNMERTELTNAINTLLRCNAVKRTGGGWNKYEKTPQFITWLHGLTFGKKEKEMF